MFPFIAKFLHDLFFSAERATLWFRGIATWLATAAAMLVAYPPETITTWGFRDWMSRFAIAAVASLAVMKKAGDKNRTDQQTRDVANSPTPSTPPAEP